MEDYEIQMLSNMRTKATKLFTQLKQNCHMDWLVTPWSLSVYDYALYEGVGVNDGKELICHLDLLVKCMMFYLIDVHSFEYDIVDRECSNNLAFKHKLIIETVPLYALCYRGLSPSEQYQSSYWILDPLVVAINTTKALAAASRKCESPVSLQEVFANIDQWAELWEELAPSWGEQ